MFSSIVARLCKHHHHIIPEHFITPKRCLYLLAVTLHFLSSLSEIPLCLGTSSEQRQKLACPKQRSPLLTHTTYCCAVMLISAHKAHTCPQKRSPQKQRDFDPALRIISIHGDPLPRTEIPHPQIPSVIPSSPTRLKFCPEDL